MGYSRGVLAAAFVVIIGTSATRAAAQDSASAEALFEAGKQLLDEGKVADACPKFEESLKLDDAIGTRFQLARCYEALGRTASAWTLYLDVAAKAKASGQADREGFARGEAARLKPGLSKLTIVVPPEARATGLEITRNGVPVGAGQWDLPLPVDPGEIQITAKGPGKKEWRGSVTVGSKGASETFELQPLEDAPAEPGGAASTSAAPAPQGLSTLQWVGIGTGALGVVGLGLGGVFAMNAQDKHEQSGCVDGACRDQNALSLNSDARAAGNLATVALVAGGVLVATGVTLFLVGPKRGAADEGSKASARLAPLVYPGVAGAQLGGTF